jgi:hypothetical protein
MKAGQVFRIGFVCRFHRELCVRPAVVLTSDISGENDAHRSQEARLPARYAACSRDGRGRGRDLRRVADRAFSARYAVRAGDAAVAIDAGCRIQAVVTFRSRDNGTAAERDSAATCASRYRGAEGRRRAGAAAGSGRKGRPADPAEVIASRTAAGLVERQPDDAAGAVASVTMRRLIEGAGQFPLLRFIAPLHWSMRDDVIGLAAGAHRRRSRRRPVDEFGRPGWFLTQVERIEK